MPSSAVISKELREEYEGKLMAVLDDEDMLAEKKRQISDVLSGELKLVRLEKQRIRRVLKGQESLQTEIPGTEVGERKRSPMVEGLLRAAGRLAEVKKVRKQIQKAAKEGGESLTTAEKHFLDRAGDAILQNAGDGKLTDKSLTGEAVARKKGRGRRG